MKVLIWLGEADFNLLKQLAKEQETSMSRLGAKAWKWYREKESKHSPNGQVVKDA